MGGGSTSIPKIGSPYLNDRLRASIGAVREIKGSEIDSVGRSSGAWLKHQ